jgi:hypothetical protein
VVFQLSHAATIQFTILRATSGRRVGRSCVKRARNNRKHKRCARSVAVGSFTRAGVTGANSFHLTGRGPHGPLKRGGYMLSAIATDATGLRSKPAARPFRIIK